jgi:3-hydroxyacyl-CoA dehydrogenase/3-hydroxy-2-methylbutyryl-CoA dehydrogenase
MLDGSGTFDTPMLSRLPDEHRRKLFDNTPFPRRLGEPKEFALLALHIAENGFINGETIRLDGALRMTAL